MDLSTAAQIVELIDVPVTILIAWFIYRHRTKKIEETFRAQIAKTEGDIRYLQGFIDASRKKK